MAAHTELSPAEPADRLALRELLDAYANCADRSTHGIWLSQETPTPTTTVSNCPSRTLAACFMSQRNSSR
jgi:hypothetical protein